jgi:hypothetical protein
MIDIEKVDRLFDIAKKFGTSPLAWVVFDKRSLVPFDQLVDGVRMETSEIVSEEKLREWAAAGLFPLLARDGDEADLGFPLYAPSRIGLLLQLERQGWTLRELREVAALEDMTIDCVLTTDMFAYEDDDVTLVARNVEEDIERDEQFLKYLETEPRPSGFPPRNDPEATPADMRERIAAARRYLEILRAGRLSEKGRDNLARTAYRIRAHDESIRLLLLEMDRGVLRGGFSPWIVFASKGWDGEKVFHSDGIRWDFTVRAPAVGDDDEPLPIRLPGVVLRDDEIMLTKPSTPREYERLWREHQLDEYFKARAKAREERICPHCLQALPDGAKPSKVYCSETCRNAARMQRFRQNSPDKYIAAQERYWTDK